MTLPVDNKKECSSGTMKSMKKETRCTPVKDKQKEILAYQRTSLTPKP
jgi:hypothetical protein